MRASFLPTLLSRLGYAVVVTVAAALIASAAAGLFAFRDWDGNDVEALPADPIAVADSAGSSRAASASGADASQPDAASAPATEPSAATARDIAGRPTLRDGDDDGAVDPPPPPPPPPPVLPTPTGEGGLLDRLTDELAATTRKLPDALPAVDRAVTRIAGTVGESTGQALRKLLDGPPR